MLENSMYLRKIKDSMHHKLGNDVNNVIVIRHYKTLDITKELFGEFTNNEKPIEVVYLCYDANKLQATALKLLNVIRDLYYKHFSKVAIEEFVAGNNIYPLWKQMFVDFIVTGKLVRAEDFIIPEINYEREMFLKSVMALIDKLSEKIAIIFVLNKLHMADLFTIELLNMYCKAPYNENIAILAAYNDTYYIDTYIKNEWNSLIQHLEKSNNLFDWAVKEIKGEVERKQVFIPVSANIREYINQIGTLIQFALIKQAKYYILVLYDKVYRENMQIDEKSKEELIYFYLYVCICSSDYERAIKLSQIQKKQAEKSNNPMDKFRYQYLFTLMNIYLRHDKTVDTYKEECNLFAEQCVDIAKEIDNEMVKFRATLIWYMAKFRGWHDIFLCDFTFDIEESFLQSLKEHSFINHLGYVYTFGYENEKNYKVDQVKEYYIDSKDIVKRMPHFQMGIDIAERINNDFLLNEAYKKCISSASAFGYYEPVEYYYNKCIKVAITRENKQEIAEIYSGLGYINIVAEQYSKANDYLAKAIDMAYELKDSVLISEVLYNMSINAFVAGEYEQASKNMLLCIKILEDTKRYHLKLCNVPKMYGIIAISNFYMKTEYTCILYMNLMEAIMKNLIERDDLESYGYWDDDLFLYFLMKAIMDKKERRYDDAMKAFKRAKVHMNCSAGAKMIGYVLWTIELAELYRIMDDTNNARITLKTCIEDLRAKQFGNKMDMLYSALDDSKYFKPKYNLNFGKIGVQEILDLVQTIATKIEAEEKTRDLTFLSEWQELFTEKEEYDEYIVTKNAATVLQRTYKVDRIIFIEVKEEGNVVSYSDSRTELSTEQVDFIVECMKKYSTEFVTGRLHKNFSEYMELLDVFGRDEVVSMAAIPVYNDSELRNVMIAYIPVYENFTYINKKISDEILMLFKYAFRQLVDANIRYRAVNEIKEINSKIRKMNLTLKEMYARLEVTAATDQLTGLLNRQGMLEKIKLEFDSEHIHGLTIIYVDLDNFKYHNDTFGHDVGDMFLKHLSKMFKEIVGDKGYTIRYGGDEFIVLLPKADVELAKPIAEAILEEFDGNRLYKAVGISDEEKEHTISVGKHLSCSIGIATTMDTHMTSINATIKRADEAMYEIKNSSKANYLVSE